MPDNPTDVIQAELREKLAQVIRDYCQHGVEPEPFGGSLDTADLAADAILALQAAQHRQEDVAGQWPERLTQRLRDVLGFMCFQLAGPAHVYQACGEFVADDGVELKKRAEDEQAFMLHKLVGFALKHGANWPAAAKADLARARAALERNQGE